MGATDHATALAQATQALARVAMAGLGMPVVSVTLRLADGRKFKLPVFPVTLAEEARSVEEFVPSPFQVAILEALDGKALRTDALGLAVGDRSRLFKPKDGLPELRQHGLVKHHSRLGFYRPDCPPPQLDD